MERLVHLGHFSKLVVRLKTAGVGQEPKLGTGEGFRLEADDGSGAQKGRPVCLQSKDSDTAGAQPLHLGLQLHCALAEFGRTEFAGGGCHPPHQVRDADAKSGQGVLLRWYEHGLGESTGREQLPEPVPGPGEMQAEVTREPAGIDPAEEQAQIRPDQISQGLLHGARTYAPKGSYPVLIFSSLSRLAFMDSSTELDPLIQAPSSRRRVWGFSRGPQSKTSVTTVASSPSGVRM